LWVSCLPTPHSPEQVTQRKSDDEDTSPKTGIAIEGNAGERRKGNSEDTEALEKSKETSQKSGAGKGVERISGADRTGKTMIALQI